MGFFHPFHFLSLFSCTLVTLCWSCLGSFHVLLTKWKQEERTWCRQGQNSPMNSLFNTAAILSIGLNFTETCLSWKQTVRQHVAPSEARELAQLCCAHGVMCVWRCLLPGFLKSSPEIQGGWERRHQEQQEHSLSWKVCGATPARQGCGALGRHMAQWGWQGCPGKGCPPCSCSANTATRHWGWAGCCPGSSELSTKKLQFFWTNWLPPEIRLCLHLFYFSCFISVGFKGTGVLTFPMKGTLLSPVSPLR